MKPMKLAVSGKGGVGKTTVAALLCRSLADMGYSVLAVDADPDANLASALGFAEDMQITPLVSMKDLIEERTGAQSGSSGGFFKLNPKVDDLPEMIWRERNGIRLMLMGTVQKGGGGCICPESAVLKALMAHLLVYRDEAVILDMEAGIEHLGRATAGAVDRLIIVVEPGKRSIDTALKIVALAGDIGIKDVCLIANKIRSEQDRDFILQAARGLSVIGLLPFDEACMKADRQRMAVWEADSKCLAPCRAIAEKLMEEKDRLA
jgi:CO dehydrogenase maturation factor